LTILEGGYDGLSDEIAASTIPESEAFPPIETANFFQTVGTAILNGTNPNQADLRVSFQRFVLEVYLPALERRIAATEAAIDDRALAARRAAMGGIPANPKAVRAATVKARRAARAESRRHFNVIAKEDGALILTQQSPTEEEVRTPSKT
jgi:hypothetical protein